MYDHHDARYNLERIVENLILLQDHYSSDPCGDCCLKHNQAIIAYAQEGLTLDNADKVKELLEAALRLAQKERDTVISCTTGNTCNIKNPQELVSEVRTMRRRINIALYGMHGDITHDFVAPHVAESETELA